MTPEDSENWMVDIEIGLARAFGWNLYDLDRTDIESLLPFIGRLNDEKREKPKTRKAYCDEVL